jgi:hypothetical protein
MRVGRSLDTAMFDVPVAFPGRCGDVQASIPLCNEHLL